jgi:hypothetical protein
MLRDPAAVRPVSTFVVVRAGRRLARLGVAPDFLRGDFGKTFSFGLIRRR